MNKVQFLEIDSSNRDRNTWINPCEFEIPVYQQDIKNSISAIDPIADGVPLEIWQSNRFMQNKVNIGSITVNVLSLTDCYGSVNDQSSIIVNGVSTLSTQQLTFGVTNLITVPTVTNTIQLSNSFVVGTTDKIVTVKVTSQHNPAFPPLYTNGVPPTFNSPIIAFFITDVTGVTNIISQSVKYPDSYDIIQREFGFSFFSNELSSGTYRVKLSFTQNPNVIYTNLSVSVTETTAIVLQDIDNYYSGAIGSRTVSSIVENSRVVSYSYLGNNIGKFVFDTPFPTLLQPGDSITITDPTNISNVNFPIFFVPVGKKNIYSGYILYNHNLDKYRPILSYDYSTKTIILDTSKSSTGTTSSGPITTDWLIGHTYSIRTIAPYTVITTKNIVSDYFVFVPGSRSPPILAYSNFYIPNTSITDNFNGYYLEIDERVPIANSNGCGFIANPDLSPFDILTSDYGITTLYLNSNNTNYLYQHIIGYTMRMITGQSKGSTATIIYYDNDYNKIQVKSPGFIKGTKPGDQCCIYKNKHENPRKIVKCETVTGNTTVLQGVVDPPFSTLIFPSMKIYILPYKRDNFNPFCYINLNNNLRQNGLLRYKIELLNLTIPNEVLKNGDAVPITLYPYLYLEINSSTVSRQGKNVIYSNNPNSTKAIFRVPINNTSKKADTTFLKINGNGMKQYINFNYADTTKITLKLPSGETMQTILQEYFTPFEPNRAAQISAVFKMIRIY